MPPNMVPGQVDADVERFAQVLCGLLAAQFTRYQELPLRVAPHPTVTPPEVAEQLEVVAIGIYPVVMASLETLGIVGVVKRWVSNHDIDCLLPPRDAMH